MSVPYAVSNGSVCSAILEGRMFGQQVLFTSFYQYSGPILPDGHAALATLATGLNGVGGVASNYAACTPAELLGLTWKLQWITPIRYVARQVAAVPATGLADNSTLTNIQAALTLQSNVADRRGHATKHVLIASSGVTNGLLDAGTRAVLGGLGTSMMLSIAIGAGQADPVMYGRARAAYTKNGVVHPAIPEVIRFINSYTVGLTSRVERRRTVGVGS